MKNFGSVLLRLTRYTVRFFTALIIVTSGFVFIPHHSNSTDQNNKQVGDQNYQFSNLTPAYEIDDGPSVLIHRYQSKYVKRGSLDPFFMLLKSDGFKPNYINEKLLKPILSSAKILVIANSYTKDYRSYSTLSAPSVYSDIEIQIIKNWVSSGGSLLILADHSPFAGGSLKLADAFGFSYMTGHAIRKDSLNSKFYVHMDFMRNPEGKNSGTLLGHQITNGELGRDKIEHFYTFGGQAIIPPPQADNLLTISDRFEAILTYRLAAEFLSAPRMEVGGFSQGSVLEFGQGRIAVFGEAGGFSSQIRTGVDPVGFNHPDADQNEEFVLSTMRWLARFKPVE